MCRAGETIPKRIADVTAGMVVLQSIDSEGLNRNTSPAFRFLFVKRYESHNFFEGGGIFVGLLKR